MSKEIAFRVFHIPTQKMYRSVEVLSLRGKFVYVAAGRAGRTYLKLNECVLMQFTGLQDKHSRKIYDGDILHCWDDDEKCYLEPVDVVWEYDSWLIHAHANDVWMHPRDWSEYEVIGDIYQNPELLKEEE